VIRIHLLPLSWNNVFIFYYPQSVTLSICLSLLAFVLKWKLFCTSSSQNCNLDKKDHGNYRPISHLSFLSILTERVVNYVFLSIYLSTNNLLNSFQSAYIKHYSWKSTLLPVHGHIIKAMSHPKVPCLALLDLPAAFDTIDHSILPERLSSWYGISSAVSWIKSNYVVLSSVLQLPYGVPQGCFLGPLILIFIYHFSDYCHI